MIPWALISLITASVAFTVGIITFKNEEKDSLGKTWKNFLIERIFGSSGNKRKIESKDYPGNMMLRLYIL